MKPTLLLISLLATTSAACDPSEKGAGAGCVLGADGDESDVWLLPTAEEAKRLDDAIRARNQGTVNLLLAKYDTLGVPAGTPCERLETKSGFVQVQAPSKDRRGWVPIHQLRSD